MDERASARKRRHRTEALVLEHRHRAGGEALREDSARAGRCRSGTPRARPRLLHGVVDGRVEQRRADPAPALSRRDQDAVHRPDAVRRRDRTGSPSRRAGSRAHAAAACAARLRTSRRRRRRPTRSARAAGRGSRSARPASRAAFAVGARGIAVREHMELAPAVAGGRFGQEHRLDGIPPRLAGGHDAATRSWRDGTAARDIVGQSAAAASRTRASASSSPPRLSLGALLRTAR